jgi:hypothetical protein
MAKLKAFSQTLLPDPVTGPDDCGTQHSPAGTDLRIDWADACSLGRHGERYFLLVIDKGTEYLANFNSKTRQNPVDLLRAYITTTGKAPRYLRVDGAKEFVSDEMVAFCTAEKIVLQVVVAYNHTMQARVEGAIGYVKQHRRVSMLEELPLVLDQCIRSAHNRPPTHAAGIRRYASHGGYSFWE